MKSGKQVEQERPYRKKVHQAVDLSVTQTKFQREVETFKASTISHRVRGIFLLSAEFPLVHVLFTAPHLNPAPAVFAAKFDFTNYDADPPSVMFVNPFTLEPIPQAGMVTSFPKLTGFIDNQPHRQDLLQGYGPDDVPFLCLEGVREYHLHPAHTGNNWFLHRKMGKGTLGFLVDQIYEYGIMSLIAHKVAVQLNFEGYHLGLKQ
ncbi:hypothetical protein GCM10028895_51350 [Pontibacter rugosus]